MSLLRIQSAMDAGHVLKSYSSKKNGGIMPLEKNEEYSGNCKGYDGGMISEIFTCKFTTRLPHPDFSE